MIYQLETPSISPELIVNICKDRIASDFKVLVVTQDPQTLLELTKSLWIMAHQEFSAERASEQDSLYMLYLTRYITRMQQFKFGLNSDIDTANAIFVDDIGVVQTRLHEYDVIFSNDHLALDGFSGLTVGTSIDGTQTIDQAKSAYLTLIQSQFKLLADNDLDISELTNGEVVDSRVLGKITGQLKDDPVLVHSLYSNQKEIKKLRIICGRAADTNLSEHEFDLLHNLKIITAHLLDYNGNLSLDKDFTILEDFQLYDDPFNNRANPMTRLSSVLHSLPLN